MELTIYQDEGFIMEILNLADHTRKVVVSEGARSLDGLRKENNLKIKEHKAEIESMREKYLKPFEEMYKPFLLALNELEEANKELSKKILQAKKSEFEDKVKKELNYLMLLNEGEYVPFELVYDPSWYDKPEKYWKPALARRVKDYLEKDDRHTYTFSFFCAKKDADCVEKLLNDLQIIYLKEEE